MKQHLTPVRKIKEGARGTYYETKTSCGGLKIIIADDEDYPVRVTCQPTGGGGCTANIEALQRLTTLLLEMNCRGDIIIEQLNKVICPSCKTKLAKGEKEIALSCSKALGRALEKHLEKNNGEG